MLLDTVNFRVYTVGMEIYLYLLLAVIYLYIAWVVEETINSYYKSLFKETEMNRLNAKLGALMSDKRYNVAEEVVIYKNPRRGYGLIWPILLINFLLRRFAKWLAHGIASTYDSPVLNTYTPRISIEESSQETEKNVGSNNNNGDGSTQILGFVHQGPAEEGKE